MGLCISIALAAVFVVVVNLVVQAFLNRRARHPERHVSEHVRLISGALHAVFRDLAQGIVALRPRSWAHELSYWAVTAAIVLALVRP